jgi:hypothetical protein
MFSLDVVQVTLSALQVCTQLLAALQGGAAPALGVLLPALAAALGASNDKLAAAALDTLQQLVSAELRFSRF